MKQFSTLQLSVSPPFAYLTLNRPQQRNAISFQMMGELLNAVMQINALPAEIRAVVISGAGGNFSAGADINDLQASANLSPEEQDAPLTLYDQALSLLNQSPKVIIAKVEGVALGGGFGLVCVADIAIASTTATFGLPEVRIGLVPAMIAPYVIQRIGITRARLLMLTGTRFDGVSAHEYGLVHEVCPEEILDECVKTILDQIRQCSPIALAACKQLIHTVASQSLEDSRSYRARLLNNLIQSEEGQEGLSALRQQRSPTWANGL